MKFAREYSNAPGNASRATVPACQEERGKYLGKINKKDLIFASIGHLARFCILSFEPCVSTFNAALTGRGFVAKTSRCNAEMPRSDAPPQCAWVCAWTYLCRVSIVGYKKKHPAPNIRHARLYIRCSRRVQEFYRQWLSASAVGLR